MLYFGGEHREDVDYITQNIVHLRDASVDDRRDDPVQARVKRRGDPVQARGPPRDAYAAGVSQPDHDWDAHVLEEPPGRDERA